MELHEEIKVISKAMLKIIFLIVSIMIIINFKDIIEVFYKLIVSSIPTAIFAVMYCYMYYFFFKNMCKIILMNDEGICIYYQLFNFVWGRRIISYEYIKKAEYSRTYMKWLTLEIKPEFSKKKKKNDIILMTDLKTHFNSVCCFLNRKLDPNQKTVSLIRFAEKIERNDQVYRDWVQPVEILVILPILIFAFMIFVENLKTIFGGLIVF